MIAESILLLVAGFVALIVGGDVLVRGGSGLGLALRLSPQTIGLTVVAFATSAPELAVTVNATASGSPGLAVGNVVGSNIANILLVLGGAAVVAPVVVRSVTIRREIPAVIGASVLFLLLALDGRVSRWDGALLLVLLAGFVSFSVVAGRRDASQDAHVGAGTSQRAGWLRSALLVAVGVVLLVVGARWLVSAATTIAAAAGLSELVIGLTVVAVGTSLPELATSVLAGVRGERDLAIGNVIGSCLFNVGAVIGLAALGSSGGIPVQPGALTFDLPVMIVVAVALLPVVFTGLAIARWEGVLFLAYYVAYLAYLLFEATDHDALPVFSSVLFTFAAPLTGVTLALMVSYQVGVRRGRRGRGRR